MNIASYYDDFVDTVVYRSGVTTGNFGLCIGKIVKFIQYYSILNFYYTIYLCNVKNNIVVAFRLMLLYFTSLYNHFNFILEYLALVLYFEVLFFH